MKAETAAVIVSAAAALAFACGGQSLTGDTWLFVVGGDTTTVSRAGLSWEAMQPAQRMVFTSRDNPVDEFIFTLARREMIVKELEFSGMLRDPDLFEARRWWLLTESAIRTHSRLLELERQAVTERDLQHYYNMTGTTVWFTLDPVSTGELRNGPEHLSELPFELAMLLDTLEAGSTGTDLDGRTVRLDSMIVTDPEWVSASLQDTIAVRNMCVSRLAYGRLRRWTLEVQTGLHKDLSTGVDTLVLAALAAYKSGDADTCDMTALAVWSDLGDFTVADIEAMVEFHATRMPAQPSDLSWLLFMADNLLLQCYMVDLLEREMPETADSIRMEADAWLMSQASEELYNLRVTLYIEDQYVLLTESTSTGERRLPETILIPPEMMEAMAQAWLAEQATVEWMKELEVVFRLEVNESVLEHLPANPLTWSAL